MFEPLISTKTLQVMAIVAFASAIGMGVLTRFQTVYAENVIGLSHAEWGLVVGISIAIGTLIRIPLGKLTDIVGRRKCILIDYSVRPIYFVAFANAKNFTQVLLLNSLNNLTEEAGMPAWEALMIDVTPRGKRARVSGAFGMIQGICDAIFPSVAALLWASFGPTWAFYFPAFVEALAFLVIYFFLAEPKRREE